MEDRQRRGWAGDDDDMGMGIGLGSVSWLRWREAHFGSGPAKENKFSSCRPDALRRAHRVKSFPLWAGVIGQPHSQVSDVAGEMGIF